MPFWPSVSRAARSIACILLLVPSTALANLLSGPAVSGEHEGWNFIPADTLRAWMEECIEANRTHPPPGNPGPFTRGYDSIVILGGQCFSAGLYTILGMGTRIVIGAAADVHKEARWESSDLADTTQAKWLWLDELLRQIGSNPNRPIKTILNGVRSSNPDPPAATPPPDHTDGGDGIVLGNPQQVPGKSYHALIFAGELSKRSSPEKESEDAATRKAVREAKETLRDECHVPEDNIRTVFPPATWDSMKTALQQVWAQMNDNEQFILIFADHANELALKKSMAMVPDPNHPGSQEEELPTEDLPTEGTGEQQSILPGIIDPAIYFEAEYISADAPVFLNDVLIGLLQASAGFTRQMVSFPPGLLLPVGQMNTIRVGATTVNASFTALGMSTGPVAGMMVSAQVPASGRATPFILVALCLVTGGIAIRRRAARVRSPR